MRSRGTRPVYLRQRGFTLLELLVVITLIALIAATLNWGRALYVRDPHDNPDELFWQAVREARELALLRDREVQLVPPSTRAGAPAAFVIRTTSKVVRTIALPARHAASTVRFLPPLPPGDGSSSFELNRSDYPSVTFYADGTCMAFRAEVKSGSQVEILEVDPWTGAPVLRPAEARRR